jgi:hypothetical protein
MPQLTAETHDVLSRIWEDLVARPGSPLSFRFVLQPAVGILGVRDGIKDARTGRSLYFWTVLHDSQTRNARLEEGLSATARILALGLLMDAIYQIWVLGTFYPTEAAIVALALAFVPYLLIRGPTARLARWRQSRASSSETHLRKQP